MVNLIIPTLLVSSLAFVTSVVAIVLVLAQRWSTHKIEWRPLVTETLEDEAEKELNEVEEDDAVTLKEALSLQRKNKIKTPIDPLDTILETNNF
jgi:hypothetical protein